MSSIDPRRVIAGDPMADPIGPMIRSIILAALRAIGGQEFRTIDEREVGPLTPTVDMLIVIFGLLVLMLVVTFVNGFVIGF